MNEIWGSEKDRQKLISNLNQLISNAKNYLVAVEELDLVRADYEECDLINHLRRMGYAEYFGEK